MNGFDSGTYTTPHGKKYVSAFLGLQKMETERQINANGKNANLILYFSLGMRKDFVIFDCFIVFFECNRSK